MGFMRAAEIGGRYVKQKDGSLTYEGVEPAAQYPNAPPVFITMSVNEPMKALFSNRNGFVVDQCVRR